MGFGDNIIGSVISSFVYGISGLLSGIAQGLVKMLGSVIRAPEVWELIKVDEEEKNFQFEGSPSDGYIVSYMGNTNKDRMGRVSGNINKYDFRAYDVKSEQKAIYFMIYKLETMHDYFKNRELATRFAKKMHAHILEKLKDEEVIKFVNYERWRELYQKKK
ncbi:hypothetical protein HZC08_01100 [Candidatus Micrarchaeota archaeon]|nr:hypothetical protein [Candidatus Micrarchaeota archaeon]